MLLALRYVEYLLGEGRYANAVSYINRCNSEGNPFGDDTILLGAFKQQANLICNKALPLIQECST